MDEWSLRVLDILSENRKLLSRFGPKSRVSAPEIGHSEHGHRLELPALQGQSNLSRPHETAFTPLISAVNGLLLTSLNMHIFLMSLCSRFDFRNSSFSSKTEMKDPNISRLG